MTIERFYNTSNNLIGVKCTTQGTLTRVEYFISMEWFLYDNGLRHEIVNRLLFINLSEYFTLFKKNIHCVKSVKMRSYFWSIFSRFWTEYGPEITPYLDIFRAVIVHKK